jgi:hypothetical protein
LRLQSADRGLDHIAQARDIGGDTFSYVHIHDEPHPLSS